MTGTLERLREALAHIMQGNDSEAPAAVQIERDLFHAAAGATLALGVLPGLAYLALGLRKQDGDASTGRRDARVDGGAIAYGAGIGLMWVAALALADWLVAAFTIPLTVALLLGGLLLSGWMRRK